MSLSPSATPPRVPVGKGLSAADKTGSGRRAIPLPDPPAVESSRGARLSPGHQLSQLAVFEPHRARRHLRDQRPAIAVQKPAAQHKILEKTPWRRKPYRPAPLPLPLLKHLLRRQRRIPLHVGLVLGKIANRIMQQ